MESNSMKESCEMRDKYIKLVLDWLDENPTINANKDPLSILYFLRSCKFDLDRTKTKIKGFYIMRAERSEWFSNRDPFLPEIQQILRIGVFLPLEEKDELDRQVVIVRTCAHDPRRHCQNSVLKVSKMILDLLLTLQPEISITGLVTIFDMTGVTARHGLQMTPMIIKRSVESWNVYPCKPKLLEFVNVPMHVNVVLNTFRYFMTPKMKSRVMVRRGTSQVNVSLPSDLGGTGPTYAELSAKWKALVENNAEFYKKYDEYKTVI